MVTITVGFKEPNEVHSHHIIQETYGLSCNTTIGGILLGIVMKVEETSMTNEWLICLSLVIFSAHVLGSLRPYWQKSIALMH